jgi:F0F1-type ATP synthase membrane subunit c/vacuolar-type H+-ATPase subunit K
MATLNNAAAADTRRKYIATGLTVVGLAMLVTGVVFIHADATTAHATAAKPEVAQNLRARRDDRGGGGFGGGDRNRNTNVNVNVNRYV